MRFTFHERYTLPNLCNPIRSAQLRSISADAVTWSRRAWREKVYDLSDVVANSRANRHKPFAAGDDFAKEPSHELAEVERYYSKRVISIANDESNVFCIPAKSIFTMVIFAYQICSIFFFLAKRVDLLSCGHACIYSSVTYHACIYRNQILLFLIAFFPDFETFLFCFG